MSNTNSGHKLIRKEDVVASVGQLLPTDVKPKQHTVCSSRLWGNLVGCKVPMLLAICHQGESGLVVVVSEKAG